MKSTIITSALLFIVFFAAAQSTTTFTQAMAVRAEKSISVELDQPFTLKTYKGNTVKVEVSVSLYNGGLETLRYLNSRGQYRLTVQSDSKHLYLSDYRLRRFAKINRAGLCEQVSYVIYVPEGMEVEGKAGAMWASRD